MKRSFYLLLILLAIVVGLLIWFFGRSKSQAVNAIPDDAKAVAELDLKELNRATGLDLGSILTQQSLSETAQTGLDLSLPAFGFISNQGHFGLVVAVKSKDRVKKVLEQTGTEVESQRGILWAAVRNWLVAFDSDKLLVMGPVAASDPGVLRNQMAALMKQKKTSTVMLDALEKRPGTLKLLSRMDVMPKAYAQTLKKWLPVDIDLSSVSAFISLEAQKKSFILSTELLSEDKQVLQSFAEADSLWRPIQGQLLDKGPGNPFLWATAGLRGDKLLSLLRKNPTIRTRLIALNMCVDADMMLRSIDGDVSLAIPSIPLGLKMPNALLTATLANKDFLRNVDSWKSGLATEAGVRFQVLRDNDFHLSADDFSTFFGVRGNQLYVTSSSRLADQACQSNSNSRLNILASQMKGKVFFATLDASMLGPLALLAGSKFGLLQLLGHVERLNLSATSSHQFALEVQCNRNLEEIFKR